MYKFKKRSSTILLYFFIVIFVIFIFSAIYNMYNTHDFKSIESFSLKKTFHSQKRKFKNFNKKHITKYTSKIGRFFKSMF